MKKVLFIIKRELKLINSKLTYILSAPFRSHTNDSFNRKRQRISTLREQHECVVLVETGTFYGHMVNAQRNFFDEIHSVEMFDYLAKMNKLVFNDSPNVYIHHGDSREILKFILGDIKPRLNGKGIIFWLDGHYSGPGTAGESNRCPIMEELNSIINAEIELSVIIIDDIRLFDGTNDYPTLDGLLLKLRSINPSFRIRIDGDSLVASL